jgi:NAD(P)-dependent dehydrogenase (short-subunit alcohol dehydrogenase family)
MVNSQFQLTSKTAVITGAGSGIGAEIARQMAAAEARVVVVGRNQERLTKVAKEIRDRGGECHALQADLLEAGAPKKIVSETIKTFGSLNILVNNAGIHEYGPFENFPLESFDRQWMTHVRAPFELVQLALPHLRPEGVVIFTSSIAGHAAFPESVAYCATKGAIVLMTMALTAELAGQGIRVNAIAPGEIATPLSKDLHADPEFVKYAISMTPYGRIGTPEDIAPVAVFLASDAARFIHGVSLPVDGGWLAQ